MRTILAALLFSASFAWSSTEEAATATNALGGRLLTLSAPGNVAFSPYSIQVALSMAYAGAEGETRVQMARALSYPQADMCPSFAALQREIQTSTHGVTLISANRLFGQAGFSFQAKYVEYLQKEYGSELQQVNFNQSSLAANTINSWIEQRTRGRIRDLLSPDSFSALTRLVLANAVYFKAKWESPFEQKLTTPRPFHLGKGITVEAPTMQAQRTYGFARHFGFRVIAVPYGDKDIQLVIFFPDFVSGLPSLERRLNPALFQEAAHLKTREINLYLPRFKLESPVWQLGNSLQRLGMPGAFDIPLGSANFNAIAPRKSNEYLYISEVAHKCFLEVKEEGTEAAAATAVIVEKSVVGIESRPPPEVHIDRPFLFAIQHRPTGALLFLGRVTDPSK